MENIYNEYDNKKIMMHDNIMELSNNQNQTANSRFHLGALSICVARYGKALTTDLVVMRSSPATGHIRCALLAN